ncbi:MAG: sigma-70 family RNA polymerase sigma factor [Planctomycetota bacterium]|nr:sigma-70 family RNA polymerase sigma factor [Planctomycetota bacterium]
MAERVDNRPLATLRSQAAPAPTPASESELIDRARAGDRDAFETLATRAMPRLLGTATRMLGPGFAAEEAVADALFRAYRHIDRFRGGARFSTWAHRIVCRVVADRYREQARDRRLKGRLGERLAGLGRAAVGEPAPVDPGERLADQERIALVREVAMGLPPTQRLVLLLVAWEGLALRDVADLLSLKYATVKSHLHHARSTVRARWAAREGSA